MGRRLLLTAVRRWTPEEDEQLRRWPKHRPLRELARLLGRSYLATRNRYHRVVGLRRPPRRRPSRAPRRAPDEPQRIADFLRLALMIQRLREQHALRGPLAGPDWVGVLLRAAGEFARRSRRLGQDPELVELQEMLLRPASPDAPAKEPKAQEPPGSGEVPARPSSTGRGRRYQN